MAHHDYRDELQQAGFDTSLITKNKHVSKDIARTMINEVSPPKNPRSPVIGNNGMMTAPGDNARIASISLKLFNLPDIDMHDENAVAERLTEFFQIYIDADAKPTIAGMAMALNGHNRFWLINVANDNIMDGRGCRNKLPQPVTQLIKRCYLMLETQWESYFNSGKINPVSGIFLAKNNYGYQDKVEYNHKVEVEEVETNVDKIRQKYIGSEEREVIEAEEVKVIEEDE